MPPRNKTSFTILLGGGSIYFSIQSKYFRFPLASAQYYISEILLHLNYTMCLLIFDLRIQKISQYLWVSLKTT